MKRISNGISIVVTTWNRHALLERALRSVQEAKRDHLIDVIVVDDYSEIPVDISQIVDLPIRLIRHSKNRGGGIARNTGIDAAKFNWVALLDDDDELLPEAFDVLFKYSEKQEYQQEVALFFSYSNFHKNRGVNKLDLKKYFEHNSEDFFCVMNKTKCQSEGLYFPDLQIGGASLLWMKLASMRGIISIDEPVAKINYDAETRMCSLEYQEKHPSSYMDFHRQEIEFIEPYQKEFENFYRKKIIGYAIFSVFSGRENEAKQFLKSLRNHLVVRLTSEIILFFPVKLLRLVFALYRRVFSGF